MRMRLGGRGTALHHLGSFRKREEADACADWARMLLAQGKAPDRRAALAVQDDAVAINVARAVAMWSEQRIDLSPGSRRTYAALAKLIADAPIGRRPVTHVTPADVQALISTLAGRGLARDTISSTRGILAGALDEIGVDPNPARHRSIRLPREDRSVIEPPPYEHVVAVLDLLAPKYAIAIALLEATGLRVGEACALRQVDLDRSAGRVRVVRHARGSVKTKRSVRWAPCPVELCELLPEGNPVLGVTPDGVRNALERACEKAKVATFSPHDLRHRWAARQVQLGVPVTQIAEWIGHNRPSMTTDVYAVVVTDTEEAWRHFVQLSNSASTASTADLRT